jgi:glycosyltransferase involved in cell wall biosynthesis
MPRKLCFVCEATQGGVRKHLLQLLRAFTQPQEGYEVSAILGDREEPGFRDELEALKKSHNLNYIFIPQMRRAIRPSQDMRAYAHVKDAMYSIGPDVVHSHSSKGGFLGRHAAYQLGIENVLHTPHVFAFAWTHGLKSRVFLGIERYAARHCRKIICVGEGQREDALKRKVAPAEKLVVVRNGIQLPEPVSPEKRAELRGALDIPPEAPAIGMVARLAPQKGVGIFVRAAAKVLQKRPDAVFLLVGGGPLEPEIRARAADLKLPPANFRMLGHREDAELLYPAFDLAMLSSLYEGLPYVLLEAMAYGVPVIATDVLGSRDVVIDGETGFLARVSDPDHIADRTLVMLEDKPFHRRCGQAARERVAKEFSFDAFIEGHRKLYAGN